MSRPPLVSVVIPFFRNAKFLEPCLQSVMAQTHPELEVVLVDDCSPVAPDLSKFARARFPVRLERTGRNSGPSVARNLGVRQARGEWIALLDADDLWLPEKIEKQLRLALEGPGCDWVYTDARHWMAGQVFKRTFSQLYGFRSGMPEGAEVHRRHLQGKSFITPSAVLIKKSAYLEMGGFNEGMRVAEDWELFTRLAILKPPRCVQEALTIYRVAPEGHHYQRLQESQELNEATLRRLHESSGSPNSSGGLEAGLASFRRHSAVEYLNAGSPGRARELLFSRELAGRWSADLVALRAFSLAPSWSYRLALKILARLPALLLFAAVAQANPGEKVFQTHCASCHQEGVGGAKKREALRELYPEQVQEALESGAMAALGRNLSAQERHDVAEYLSSKTWGDESRFEIPRAAYCNEAKNPWNAAAPGWAGWGNSVTNSRFQPTAAAGLRAKDVPRLKLKWAFGFPGEQAVSAQPVIAGGRLFLGTYGGRIYSIDAKSGCLHWMFRAQAAVRNAVTLGKVSAGRQAIFFGDKEANLYALDAKTGKALWKVKADSQTHSKIIGSPLFHQGKIYVSFASQEEGWAMDPAYPCCKFRGNVAAFDAKDGKQLWRTYLVPEPQPTVKNSKGTQNYGPSGVPSLASPTLDLKRGLLYVTTGNNYSDPTSASADSVVALRAATGEMLWTRRGLPGRDKSNTDDAWNLGCHQKGEARANCPKANTKDVDFLASAILVERKQGPSLVIGTQKWGVLALEAGTGKVAWTEAERFAQPFLRHGWGPTVVGERIFLGTTEGSIEALELGSGKVLWTTPPLCKSVPCDHSISAAVTAIDGVVFAGGRDGHLRAHSMEDGSVLWDFPTMAEIKTVNGVRAKGGSIDGAGPSVAGGMVFVTSGYDRFVPGNLLLAFSVDGK